MNAIKKAGLFTTGALALTLMFSDAKDVNAQTKPVKNPKQTTATALAFNDNAKPDTLKLSVEDSARMHSESGESMGFIIVRGKEAPPKEEMVKYFEENFKAQGVEAKVFVEQLDKGNGVAFVAYLHGSSTTGTMSSAKLKDQLPFLMSAQKGFTNRYYKAQKAKITASASIGYDNN